MILKNIFCLVYDPIIVMILWKEINWANGGHVDDDLVNRIVKLHDEFLGDELDIQIF
jgi:hypothetical protein